MGCYSWLDCVTGEQIRIGSRRKVYVLIPKEFGGGHIETYHYDGHGNFDSVNIHRTVASWNKSSLNEAMLEKPPKREKYCGLWDYEKDELREAGKTEEEIREANERERDKQYEAELTRRRNRLKAMEDYKNLSPEEFKAVYDDPLETIRLIGVFIACHDEGDVSIPFPIKVTYDEKAVYEDCPPSKDDPKQGCD